MDRHGSAPHAGNIAYCLITLFALSIVSACFGLRIRNLSLQSLPRLPLIRLYLLAVYVWGICFIVSAATLRFGFEDSTETLCYASIILCLVFYVVDKVLIYLFLVERAHIVRSGRLSRQKDYWYILNLAIVALGFGSIAVFSFMYPVDELSPIDHTCRIGLPFKISLPLLIYDITINVYLTCHFIYFARPQMKKWATKQLTSLPNLRIFHHLHDGESDIRPAAANHQRSNLTKLARRTLKGMCVMLSATIVNLAILFHMSGREEQWMCFLLCSLDVAVGIVTLHWVTSDPSEKDLGTTPVEKKRPRVVDSRRYSSGPHFRDRSITLRDGVGLSSCNTNAWADDHRPENIVEPNKILVSTSFGCDRTLEES